MSVTTPQPTPGTGPYADAALTYHRHGWSPLPLPPRAKAPVPEGWTGARGATPSGADVFAWTETNGTGNIALRLPPNVIGVDVDNYDAKPGGLVLAQLEATLGALPPTWRSTSRDDGASGIRLYRIPEGLRWPGGMGPGIDTLRYDHRYAVVWPSVHPKTGGTYRWVTPDGTPSIGDIPNPDDLPDLPDAWVAHFTRGEISTEQPHAGLDTTAATTWLGARGQGTPCKHMQRALDRGLTDLTTTPEGGRHDAALRLINRLAWLAGEGHTGAIPALQQAGATFLASTAGARRPGDAEAEWDRMLTGGVDIAAGAHPHHPGADPCTDPLHHLIPKDQPWPATTASSSTTPSAPASSPSSSASPRPASASPSTAPTTNAPAPGAGPAPATSPAAPATSPGTASTATAETPLEGTVVDRTTWWPRDLTAALADDVEEEQPQHLVRNDGHPAFYPGRVNGIIGPSESGKTWVGLHAVRQAVRAHERVTIIDLEDSDIGVIGRLRASGLTATEIDEHVAYINPDEPFHPILPTGVDFAEHLATWAPTLVILDGFNAAMTLQGLDLKDNKDATAFMQTVLKPIAKAGPTVVYIDHTPKDKEHGTSGGIGAQAKRAMTTGCTLRVEPVQPFGKGQNGRLRLHVDKDRLGTVRGVSAPGKAGHWFGDLILTSHPDGTVQLEVTAPDNYDVEHREVQAFRPTMLMERVSTWLTDHDGAGRNEVITNVRGNDKHIGTALKVLVDEGWVTVTKQGQKSLHTVTRPFTEATDGILEAPGANRGPTGGQAPGNATGGHRGPTGGDVVPQSPAPSATPKSTSVFAPEAGPQIVHRVVAGKQVLVDLRTGNLVQRDETTGVLIDTSTGEVLDDTQAPA